MRDQCLHHRKKLLIFFSTAYSYCYSRVCRANTADAPVWFYSEQHFTFGELWQRFSGSIPDPSFIFFLSSYSTNEHLTEHPRHSHINSFFPAALSNNKPLFFYSFISPWTSHLLPFHQEQTWDVAAISESDLISPSPQRKTIILDQGLFMTKES